MAQTATVLSVLREGWTDDRLQAQMENENFPLSRFESVRGTAIGSQAQVPILTGRSGSFTTVGATGGNINPPLHQPTAKATYTLPYHWFHIATDASAIAQSKGGGALSIIDALDLELTGGLENLRHQVSRQFVTNGDAILAHLINSGGSSATYKLTPSASEGAAYGFSALQRGWLQAGFPVSIGTTGTTNSLVSNETILSVNTSPTAPTFTVSTAGNATGGTHFVYVPNPNTATAANPEMYGLRSIVNSTGAIGGLNPATAGQEYWQAALRDTTTTVLSLDALLAAQQAVLQNSNKSGTAMWTGFKQRAKFYSLLQGQVRYSGDGNLSAGAVESVTWNGLKVEAFADILDTDVFLLTLEDLVRVHTGLDKPTWASSIEGSTAGSMWKQGTTQFVDALGYGVQLGARRRNTHAAFTALG